jgi:hypothetical protein
MTAKHYLYASILATILTTCHEPGSTLQQVKKEQVYNLSYELEHLFMIDRLPEFRDHSIVGQVSSYDTTGGNNDGFSGMYSCLRKEDDGLVIADLKGPGVINRIWTPTPSDDTIEFYFDGEQEARIRLKFYDLFSGEVYPFIHPVAGNEVGGYFCYVPIPFRESCKIIYRGDVMYFYQIQYRLYEDGLAAESYPVEWADKDKQLLEKICHQWSGIDGGLQRYLEEKYPGYHRQTETFTLAPGDSRIFFRKSGGGRIVNLELHASAAFSGLYKDILLEAWWEDDQQPAIQCPVADFFGYAYGNPSMQGLLIGSREGVHYCYIPMPFEKNARLRLIYEPREGVQQDAFEITAVTGCADVPRDPSEGRFYASWKREIYPENGKPYVFLDAGGRGHYIGTIFQAQGLKPGMTRFFEGDDSTVVDGVMRIHGTGSEDYFNGGWYAIPDRWDKAFSLPVHGALDYSVIYARTGGYRFYLADKIPWQESFLHAIEHGPEGNRYPVDYTSVALYYSDSAPECICSPGSGLREVYMPDTLVIHPILMDITVGLDARAGFSEWETLTIAGNEHSRVRINLEELQDGNYKMLLSCYAHPEGGSFSVWQRQKRITGSVSTFAGQTVQMTDMTMGEIVINDFYQSVTIEIEPPAGRRHLRINNLTFIKVQI